jgi:ABC-type nitrate/sulfonate/bicarbonate transport system substrate-binding protein
MRTVEYRVLAEEDEPVVTRLGLGVGRRPGRVLAFLALRREESEDEAEPATGLLIRLGTGLGREAVIGALSTLTDRGLLAEGTLDLESSTGGRPPKAWRATGDLEGTIEASDRSNARVLTDRALSMAASDADEDRPDVEPATPVRLALNWLPNGLQLPFYAPAFGRDPDLDVRIDHRRGSERSLAAVIDGEADVGLVGAATLARARESGDPVVPLAVVYQRAMTVLYTERERFGEPLTRLDQLEGRRVGMPPDAESRLLGRLFLAQAGLEGVETVETEGEEADALLSGTADVVTGSVSDPRELRAAGETIDVLSIAEHFPIYGPTLAVRPGTLRERRGAIERFLVGTIRGWAAAVEDPAAVGAHAADVIGVDDPTALSRTFERAAAEFGESKGSREHGWGHHDEAGWERLSAALRHTAFERVT